MDCVLHKCSIDIKLSQCDNCTVVMKDPCSWAINAKIFRGRYHAALQLSKCSVQSMGVGTGVRDKSLSGKVLAVESRPPGYIRSSVFLGTSL